MKAFSIHIVGLSNTANHFNFEMGDAFFETYAGGLISEGTVNSAVRVDKHESFIEVDFVIDGHVRLVCDRSLQPFDQPIAINKKIVFKYGDQEEELSDEIVVIKRDRATLELGQYVSEFIILDLPMKKLHPSLMGVEEDELEGKLVYTSAGDGEAGQEVIDPRWEQLKKLK